MSHTETTQELFTRSDPFPARAVALEAAARCGVPVEACNAIRARAVGAHLTARDWMRLALSEAERWIDEAA